MTGRLWNFSVSPARAAEFEEVARDTALPMVRGRMGCHAVYFFRGPEPGNYRLLTLFLSRKAMQVAAMSPEWAASGEILERFGVSLHPDESILLETVSVFLAGEKAEAPSGGPLSV